MKLASLRVTCLQMVRRVTCNLVLGAFSCSGKRCQGDVTALCDISASSKKKPLPGVEGGSIGCSLEL